MLLQPFDPSDPPFDNVPLFRTLVGSLQYLTLTRPDIAFAVNTVCQHMHQPKLSHFLAVKRLIRYIMVLSIMVFISLMVLFL